MVTIIIISVLLLVSIGLNVFLIRKCLKFDTLIQSMWNTLQQCKQEYSATLERITNIDKLGAFATDDEVGFVFQFIKQQITLLSTFFDKYTYEDRTNQQRNPKQSS